MPITSSLFSGLTTIPACCVYFLAQLEAARRLVIQLEAFALLFPEPPAGRQTEAREEGGRKKAGSSYLLLVMARSFIIRSFVDFGPFKIGSVSGLRPETKSSIPIALCIIG